MTNVLDKSLDLGTAVTSITDITLWISFPFEVSLLLEVADLLCRDSEEPILEEESVAARAPSESISINTIGYWDTSEK